MGYGDRSPVGIFWYRFWLLLVRVFISDFHRSVSLGPQYAVYCRVSIGLESGRSMAKKGFIMQMFNQIVQSARAGIIGEYTSTVRVVDALLDLRSEAADLDQAQLVGELDEALSAMPGRNVVANTWLVETLDRFEGAFDALPERCPEPVS